jgi:hypothetical protein
MSRPIACHAPLALVSAFLLALPLRASADACTDRLAAQLMRLPHGGAPYEALTTVDSAGFKTVILQRFQHELHYANATIDPKGAPEILMHDGVTYMADGAGGWTRVHAADPAEMQRQATETRAAQAAAILQASCDTLPHDGRTVDRISGRIAPVPPYDGELAILYLVDPATGNEVRTEMDYSTNGVAMRATFDFTPAPGLALPVPGQ